MKTFKAWARKRNSPFPYVTTEIKANSKKEVIKYLNDNNYEYIAKPYLKKS